MRHNEVRDITANLLSEVCLDVAVEPMLNELTGETFNLRSTNVSDDARLDLSARGVWTKYQRAFFDIRVFDPLARRYQGRPEPPAIIYNQRKGKEATLQCSYLRGGERNIHSPCIQCPRWHG